MISICFQIDPLPTQVCPCTVSKEGWLSDLRVMKVEEAGAIDAVPTSPLASSLTEIAQALVYHYAVLVAEPDEVGIVTRADFLRLFPG